MHDSLAPEPELIDLLHLGRAKVIGAWRVGDVVIDPGPGSCLDRLLGTLERHPPRVFALTHIHLDHAGATGSLLARFPNAEVWVHERGGDRRGLSPASARAGAAHAGHALTGLAACSDCLAARRR